MLRASRGASRAALLTVGVAAVVALAIIPAATANAATTIDAPLGVGNAARFGVLGASTVTNTGTSVITGDVGVASGTAISGFPPGVVVSGSLHSDDQPAILAQADATKAYNTASSLTPKSSGLDQLGGRTLSPGVYAGTDLQITGDLTLKGSANSVWVFQVGNTLKTASSSRVLFSGGASACNVFWKVGSSATLGTGSTFAGTIVALQSITATTTANVTGRLLARNGAVTLDTNTVTRSTGCNTSNAAIVATTPHITSGSPVAAALNKPYSFRVTASGTPHARFSVSTGTLPAGLTLNPSTGVISGTPTALGRSVFTITARNSATSSSSVVLALSVTALGGLALTGVDPAPALAGGLALVVGGMALMFVTRRRKSLHSA